MPSGHTIPGTVTPLRPVSPEATVYLERLEAIELVQAFSRGDREAYLANLARGLAHADRLAHALAYVAAMLLGDHLDLQLEDTTQGVSRVAEYLDELRERAKTGLDLT